MDKATLQIGGRIKRLRLQRGMNQAQLAQALDVSPSYLNLIEHNRRRITVPLLFNIASLLGVKVSELVDNDDKQLVGDLMELFGDDLFIDSDLTNQDIRDLVQSHASVARAILKLFDHVRQLEHETSTSENYAAGYNLAADSVSDYLQENANYFEPLESIAETLRQKISCDNDHLLDRLRIYLKDEFAIETNIANLPPDIKRHYDEKSQTLTISDVLDLRSTVFVIAQHVGRLIGDAAINTLIDDSTLPKPDSIGLIRTVLSAYMAAAIIMPYSEFYHACITMRYDIDRIGRHFHASFEQVCHRITTLQRPGMSGIPMHLVRTDIAGNISKRFSLSGIHIPRHSGCCPRWNIYSAFLNPDQINIQISQMPDGHRYFCIAKTIVKGGYSYNASRRYLSIGLGCSVIHANQLIYSDNIDVYNQNATVPIGRGCRICPRNDCIQRAHPSADHRFINESADAMENRYMETI